MQHRLRISHHKTYQSRCSHIGKISYSRYEGHNDDYVSIFLGFTMKQSKQNYKTLYVFDSCFPESLSLIKGRFSLYHFSIKFATSFALPCIVIIQLQNYVLTISCGRVQHSSNSTTWTNSHSTHGSINLHTIFTKLHRNLDAMSPTKHMVAHMYEYLS